MSSSSNRYGVVYLLRRLADDIEEGRYNNAEGTLSWVMRKIEPRDGFEQSTPTDVQVLTVFLTRENKTGEGS